MVKKIPKKYQKGKKIVAITKTVIYNIVTNSVILL